MLKTLLISGLLLIFPALSTAADVDLAEVVKTLETPFKRETPETARIGDFTAQFIQQAHIASIDRVQEGSGTVSFRFLPGAAQTAATAQFRWDYEQPDVQEIISDGRTMWVYMPDNKQVIESDISRMSAEQGENPVTFLSGLGDLSRDFSIAWGSAPVDEDGHFILKLVPRQKSQMIENIVVVVNKDAVESWRNSRLTGELFPIRATIVTDLQGNRTSIRFERIRVNQGLTADLFRFRKPDDVELVRPEQMTF
jgi:outer membrane lipoprotein carrier protein